MSKRKHSWGPPDPYGNQKCAHCGEESTMVRNSRGRGMHRAQWLGKPGSRYLMDGVRPCAGATPNP